MMYLRPRQPLVLAMDWCLIEVMVVFEGLKGRGSVKGMDVSLHVDPL
jgi:hypothetical protein